MVKWESSQVPEEFQTIKNQTFAYFSLAFSHLSQQEELEGQQVEEAVEPEDEPKYRRPKTRARISNNVRNTPVPLVPPHSEETYHLHPFLLGLPHLIPEINLSS